MGLTGRIWGSYKILLGVFSLAFSFAAVASSTCRSFGPPIRPVVNPFTADFKGVEPIPEYRPPRLNKKELRDILGVGNLTEAEISERLRSETTSTPLHLTDIYRTAVQYALKIRYDLDKDAQTWSSLAEKRYSYLRALFTEIATFSGWWAKDYRLEYLDAFVFEGGLGEVLVIRISDGAVFRGTVAGQTPEYERDRLSFDEMTEINERDS